jgi:predicted HicB family RNase H-like nuclease
MARIHYVIPDDLHRKAKGIAALQGITLKDFITSAIAEAVDRAVDQQQGRRF